MTVHACGFERGSPDCLLSHEPAVLAAEAKMLIVEPDAAMQAMGRALANGQKEEAALWAEILQAAISYEALQMDRLGAQADATGAMAISSAVETVAVQTLQKVAEILLPASREGRRHPAIHAAMDVIEGFQGQVERMAG